MMKNKYTKEFEDFFRNNINKYTKEEFIMLLEKRYKIKMSYNAMKSFIRRHKIKDRYIDYKENMIRAEKLPIGAEKYKKDTIYVKVGYPSVWRRKARVMYEKYHNCKLSDDDYILFLNQDRNDFSKENLFKSTNNEQCCLHNWGTFSKNPELTKTGILSARLMIKTKEISKNFI